MRGGLKSEVGPSLSETRGHSWFYQSLRVRVFRDGILEHSSVPERSSITDSFFITLQHY